MKDRRWVTDKSGARVRAGDYVTIDHDHYGPALVVEVTPARPGVWVHRTNENGSNTRWFPRTEVMK